MISKGTENQYIHVHCGTDSSSDLYYTLAAHTHKVTQLGGL